MHIVYFLDFVHYEFGLFECELIGIVLLKLYEFFFQIVDLSEGLLKLFDLKLVDLALYFHLILIYYIYRDFLFHMLLEKERF